MLVSKKAEVSKERQAPEGAEHKTAEQQKLSCAHLHEMQDPHLCLFLAQISSQFLKT